MNIFQKYLQKWIPHTLLPFFDNLQLINTSYAYGGKILHWVPCGPKKHIRLFRSCIKNLTKMLYILGVPKALLLPFFLSPYLHNFVPLDSLSLFFLQSRPLIVTQVLVGYLRDNLDICIWFRFTIIDPQKIIRIVLKV